MRIAFVLAAMAPLLLTACASTGRSLPAAPINSSVTGFIDKTAQTEDGQHRYVTYVPFAYSPGNDWPLVVFLHGAGERGSDGVVQSEVGIGTAIRRNPERWPAIVIMPQCPEGATWASALPVVEAAMARTMTEYQIDENRVYLTGLSMGGFGTWIWGGLQPDRFAALMPVCGGGDPDFIARLGGAEASPAGTLEDRVRGLAMVPIWAFHGADDEVVPPELSRDMVERVKALGGHVRYTEFPETGHNSWDQAYGHAEAVAWLFEQRRGR